MEVIAKAKDIPVSAQKVRLVVDTVRGKKLDDALATLEFLPQKSARDVYKVVKSAASNAEQNFDLDPDDLYVKRIYADEGQSFRRFRARARGRVARRMKRSAHITVILDEIEEGA
jgi:large subunit ribosomal protein L22